MVSGVCRFTKKQEMRGCAIRHRVSPEFYWVAHLPNPSRETKFSGANGDREAFIFPVQLITSRIGNFTRLVLTLAICDGYTYIDCELGVLFVVQISRVIRYIVTVVPHQLGKLRLVMLDFFLNQVSYVRWRD